VPTVRRSVSNNRVSSQVKRTQASFLTVKSVDERLTEKLALYKASVASSQESNQAFVTTRSRRARYLVCSPTLFRASSVPPKQSDPKQLALADELDNCTR
jgi:hypothetical protein